MKQNARKKLKIALVILSVILVILVGFALYLYTSQNPADLDAPETTGILDTAGAAEGSEATSASEETTEDTEPAAPTTAPATEVPEEPPMEIATKFGLLQYPGKWEDRVRVEVYDSGVVGNVDIYGTVDGMEEKLFTIWFGKVTENSFVVGVLETGGMSMNVSVELYDFAADAEWTAAQLDVFSAMQEDFNYITEKLAENYNFRKGAAMQNGSQNEGSTKDPQDKPAQTTKPEETTAPTEAEKPGEDMEISTPYGKLYLPGEWAEQIRAEEVPVSYGYVLDVYGIVEGVKVKLFTVFFAEISENSFPVGVLTVDDVAVDVSIELAELSDEDRFDDEAMNILAAMQESVNYLIAKLVENPNFSAL